MKLGAQLIEDNSFEPMLEKHDIVFFNDDGEPLEKCLNKQCLVDFGNGECLINRLDPNADNSEIVWAAPIISIKKDIEF
jgi:hypothetical protein